MKLLLIIIILHSTLQRNLQTCPKIACFSQIKRDDYGQICAIRSYTENILELYKCPSGKSCNLNTVLDLSWDLLDTFIFKPDWAYQQQDVTYCITQQEQSLYMEDSSTIVEDMIIFVLSQIDYDSLELCYSKIDFCTDFGPLKSDILAKECTDWKDCKFTQKINQDDQQELNDKWNGWFINWGKPFGETYSNKKGNQRRELEIFQSNSIKLVERLLQKFRMASESKTNKKDTSFNSKKKKEKKIENDIEIQLKDFKSWFQNYSYISNLTFQDFDDAYKKYYKAYKYSELELDEVFRDEIDEDEDLDEDLDDKQNQQEDERLYGNCDCGLSGNKRCSIGLGDPYMCNFMNEVCQVFRGQDINLENAYFNMYAGFYYHQLKGAPDCVFDSLTFYKKLKKISKG